MFGLRLYLYLRDNNFPAHAWCINTSAALRPRLSPTIITASLRDDGFIPTFDSRLLLGQ